MLTVLTEDYLVDLEVVRSAWLLENGNVRVDIGEDYVPAEFAGDEAKRVWNLLRDYAAHSTWNRSDPCGD